MASLSVKVYFTGLKLRARAGGAGGLGALLDVYLVKGEDDDAGLWGLEAYVLDELLDGGEVGQLLRAVEEVI